MHRRRLALVCALACLSLAPQERRADREIEESIRRNLAGRAELGKVRVRVEDGVVRLGGEGVSRRAREEAEDAARAEPGVQSVRNEIREAWNLRARLEPVLARLEQRALAALTLLPLALVALVVLAVSWRLARFLSERKRPFRRVRNRFLRDLARRVARASVFLLGLLVALEIVGATAMVGAVLGTAGVVSLVVGLAFRDLAENYLATILLSLRQPFEPDDHLVIEGHEGKVVRLTSRSTILMTLDGNHLHVPNATVFKGVILNYSRNPLRRFQFVAPVGKGDSPELALPAALEALTAVDGVRVEPSAAAEIAALLPDRVELRLSAWVDQRQHDVARVRSEAQRAVKRALDVPLDGRSTRRVAPADTSVDRDLEQQIAAERARGNGDMLDRGAAHE